MASAGSSQYECSKCKIYKDIKEYALDKYKQPYPRCQPCFKKDNVEFWSKQKFKVCATCKVDIPLRNYYMWENVPYRNCRDCWEAETLKKRAVAREAAAGRKRKSDDSECSRQPQPIRESEADSMRVLYQQVMEQRANMQKRMDEDPAGLLREIFAANNVDEQNQDEEIDRAFPEYARRKITKF